MLNIKKNPKLLIANKILLTIKIKIQAINY